MEWIDNDVTIEIFDGTTRVLDVLDDLSNAERIQFSQHIPGGDYGDASFFIEREVTAPLLFEIGHRVVMTNGQTVVYEGFISGISYVVELDYQGINFLCSGGTDWHLMKYPLEKRWADSRISEDIWPIRTGAGEDKYSIDRNGRIQIMPKGVAFVQYDSLNLRYTMPVGQTIKRVKYDYTLITSAAAPTWRLGLYDQIGAAWLAYVDRSTAGTSTGSVDHTLATPRNYVELTLNSFNVASQTPVEDGSMLGRFTNIMVYSETDNPITMTTVAQDIVTEVSTAGYLNTSTVWIGTPATQLTVEPFISSGYPNVADILNDIVSRGDGAYNRWYWGIKDSSFGINLVGSSQKQYLLLALSYDSGTSSIASGKPVLYLEQYPAITDWEYEVSFGDENIATGVELLQDGAAIANHIITSRTDLNRRIVYQTPADDANLADATSKTNYFVLAGTRLDAGDCDQAEATAYARRFLATYKDPPYKLLRPLVLVGYIKTKSGAIVPVRLVRPGERIKLTNFVSTLSGQEPVFVISAVGHNIEDESVVITTGIPGAPIGARQVLRPVSAPPDDLIAIGGGGGGGGGGRNDPGWNWWERYSKVSGLKGWDARNAWTGMSLAQRRKWKKTEWKAWKKKKG